MSEPVEIDDPRDTLDLVVAGAQILATFSAFGALLFLAQQVARAKEQIVGARADANIQRTLDFEGRYISREFSRIVSPLLAYFRVTDARDCVDKIRAELTSPHAEAPCLPRTPRNPSAPQACVNDIQHVLGFFEDLGTAHDKELVDSDVLLLSFGNAPVQILMECWWYVCWQRDGLLGSETKLFLEFEKLVRWLLKSETEFSVFKPNPTVRLLALPPDDCPDDWAAWNLCGELSAALSWRLGIDTEARIQTLREDVERIVDTMLPKAGHGPVAQVLAVPPFLDLDDADWVRQRAEALRIRDQLHGLDPAQLRTLITRLPETPAVQSVGVA